MTGPENACGSRGEILQQIARLSKANNIIAPAGDTKGYV